VITGDMPPALHALQTHIKQNSNLHNLLQEMPIVEEFWKLRIHPSYNLQNKALQDKAYFVPQPMFHSYLVKANPQLKTTFHALDIKPLGDLFNSVTNLFFTNEEFTRMIKGAASQLCSTLNLPKFTGNKVRRTSAILSDLVDRIPPAIKAIMRLGLFCSLSFSYIRRR
jgi:hypothetical protein